MKKDTGEQLGRFTSSVAIQLSSIISDMDYISSDIIGRPDFLKNARMLAVGEGTNYELQESYYYLSNDIKAYYRVKSNYQIIWFNDRGNYIDSGAHDVASSFKTTIGQEPILTWPVKEIADKKRGAIYVFQSTGEEFFSSGNPELSAVRSVRLPSGIVGYMLVKVPIQELDYIFGEHDSSESGLCVLSSDGDTLYRNALFPAFLDFPAMMENTAKPKLDEGRYLYRVSTDKNTGITVISTKEYGLLYRDIWTDSWYLICLAFLLLGLMVFCISYYSKRLSIPLVQLRNRMTGMTLDTLAEPESTKVGKSYEEIEILSHSFDQMRNRLAEMVQKEILLTQIQSDERFRALQSQINPHFIFNSLNAISIMDQYGSRQQVSAACQELAQIIRYASQQDSDDATIAEEIEQAVSYVDIMQMRFGSRITADIHADSETALTPVPRLMLQPFLENIFAHAMDVHHQNIHIEISVTNRQDRLAILIQDNGRGFPPDVISTITEKMENATLGKIQEIRKHPITGGIGIVNTLSRLSLFFGDKFSFELRNKTTGGACVELNIERGNTHA